MPGDIAKIWDWGSRPLKGGYQGRMRKNFWRSVGMLFESLGMSPETGAIVSRPSPHRRYPKSRRPAITGGIHRPGTRLVRHEGAPPAVIPRTDRLLRRPGRHQGHWDVVLLADLPVHMIAARRKTLRPELDLHSLHGLLAEHAPLSHAYVERVTARPGNGSVSMFRFGQSYGAILGVLAAMGCPMTLVAPKHFQKWAGCGPAPDAARQRAAQLFTDSAEQAGQKAGLPSR
jgi:hypothetical protein